MSTSMVKPKRKVTPERRAAPVPGPFRRIAVGVDGYSEGLDAVALGVALARITGAELMLVAVHPDPLVVLPAGVDWKSMHRQARLAVRRARDALAPEARIVVETDISVARALHRVIVREHRDLLVVGSSRAAAQGHVRIGKRTRQLLGRFESPLGIASRGLLEDPGLKLRRIGVGFDGTEESQAALDLAGALALAAGAELYVRGIVDDRVPTLPWAGIAFVPEVWSDVVSSEAASLRKRAVAAAKRTGARVNVETLSGRPADALLTLSTNVDLLVIGSRRWGPAARVLLGSTGESVTRDAACPVLAVPRRSNP